MSVPATPERHFLVHAPAAILEGIERAVLHPAERARIADELAAFGLQHQRVAAASERVVADLRKRPQARGNERFAFASAELPYLVAARDPHGIVEAIEMAGRLRTASEAEAFFAAEGEKLGVHVRKLEQTMLPPTQAELGAWTLCQLERIAAAAPAARMWPLGRRRPVEAAGLSLLLGQLGPVWSQGRGRWLAALIGPMPDAAQDARLLAGTGVDPAEARAAWGQPDPAAPIAQALGELLRPGAMLTPGLRADAATSLLPVAAIETVARLFTERWQELSAHAARYFLNEQLGEWRLLVVAALHCAHARGEPLLEGQEVLPFGYRWPPLPEPPGTPLRP